MAAGFKTGGRTKGTPNKSSAEVREAIALFASNNVEKLQEWLEAIAEKDPSKAADLFMKVIEYHIPKLSRAELTGTGGNALFPTNVTVNVVSPEKDA